MNYDEAQQVAVSHRDGPMMVLAGPGSGKTMVITGRTRTLIEEYGIPPEQILVITFTKAAATEMRDRFSRMMGGSFGVRFSTFHSLFFLILRAAYGYKPEQIIREEEQYAFLRQQVEALEKQTNALDIADEKDFIRDLLSEIGTVKSEELDPSHYYSMNCPEETFQAIFRGYEDWMRQQNRIDFDDMMLLCKELFLARPDILSAWQSRFRYILVDEFQDINLLQYRLVRMLAAPQDNLFIVGDDDQSIYRFRGAKPEIMLHFPQDYPQAGRVLLNRNYRSAEPIVKAAGRLIAHNKKRFGKELYAALSLPEAALKIGEFKDRREENAAIAEQILRYRAEGIPLTQIAVLFRTSLAARPLAETLMAYNIPFRMKETLPNPYEHWICQNLLSYMELAETAGRSPEKPAPAPPGTGCAPREISSADAASRDALSVDAASMDAASRDAASMYATSRDAVSMDAVSMLRHNFLQIMNRPNRYLTRESLPDSPSFLREAHSRPGQSLLRRYLNYWGSFYLDKDWMAERLARLGQDLEMLATLAPYPAIHYIRHVIGYDGFLASYAEFRRIPAEDLVAQLEELAEGAKPFPTLTAWKAHMQKYGDELKRHRHRQAMEAVTLSTMHAGKGLEYDVVFIPDAVEGSTPHKKALREEDLEEERRLFYVAVTRAKRLLHLSTVKTLYGKPQTASRFLGELTASVDDFKPGMQVFHKTYGPGTVRSVSDGKICIFFERTHAEKTLHLDFCVTNRLLSLPG